VLSSHFGQFDQLTSCLRRAICNTAPFSQLMRANKPVWQMTEHLPSLPTPEPCRHGNKSSKRVNNLLLHTLIPGGDRFAENYSTMPLRRTLWRWPLKASVSSDNTDGRKRTDDDKRHKHMRAGSFCG
jgi:hypothetical protein